MGQFFLLLPSYVSPRSKEMKAVLQIDNCRAEECVSCVAKTSCDRKAIKQLEDEDTPIIQQAWCDGCGVCISFCPHQAILLQD